MVGYWKFLNNKSQIPNIKQITMIEIQNSKPQRKNEIFTPYDRA
jgi:hypothetical protein